jgi:cytochrome-b5 reductase
MSTALAPGYIHGIYIPTGLLLVGIYIVRQEWLPYAVGVAVLLGAFKVYNNRTSSIGL